MQTMFGEKSDINVLFCILSMKAYSALKTGHPMVRNPAPDVSLDSVCLCVSAVTSSAFTEISIETRQADSFTASFMLGPALHISQPQVIIRCMRTLSFMISGLYRELRAMCLQIEEIPADIEEQAVPLFKLTADKQCGNELQKLVAYSFIKQGIMSKSIYLAAKGKCFHERFKLRLLYAW